MEQKQNKLDNLGSIKNLKTIIRDEFSNFQITQEKFPDESTKVDELILLYSSLNRNLSTYPRKQIPVLSMFWTCFATFIQASRLAFEGHVPEASTMISKSAEAVAVARKMTLAPELIEVWLKKPEMTRNEYKDKWGRPFPEDDTLLHPEIFAAWDFTSESGRHPNFAASIFNIDLAYIDSHNQVFFNHSYFDDEANLKRFINYVINIYIVYAKAFVVIFDGYLSTSWITELNRIDREYNSYKNKIRHELQVESEIEVQNVTNEIERKWFVKKMPDLSEVVPLHYERYFLERGNGVEVRISKVNDMYKYEKKVELSGLERTREKKEISAEEFNKLKGGASEAIIRDRYDISSNPDVAIQIYHGRFEGLVRAEVEFKSEDEANAFVPFDWMGEEMTGLPIARDGQLIDLSDEEFRSYLK